MARLADRLHGWLESCNSICKYFSIASMIWFNAKAVYIVYIYIISQMKNQPRTIAQKMMWWRVITIGKHYHHLINPRHRKRPTACIHIIPYNFISVVFACFPPLPIACYAFCLHLTSSASPGLWFLSATRLCGFLLCFWLFVLQSLNFVNQFAFLGIQPHKFVHIIASLVVTIVGVVFFAPLTWPLLGRSSKTWRDYHSQLFNLLMIEHQKFHLHAVYDISEIWNI